VTGLVLYDHELSDDAYMVRLFLGLVGIPFARQTVDFFPGRENEKPAFRRLNPAGDLPVLCDGSFVIRDAEAILAYLARKFGSTWLPDAAEPFGAVLSWLGFARRYLGAASEARLAAMLGFPGEVGELVAEARRAFRIVDDHLTAREFSDAGWLVGEGPTIADIAVFPAVALSRDAGIEHDEFPALRRWIRRVRRLPGFVTMPGIPEYY
jgi:glutathione S-transferase